MALNGILISIIEMECIHTSCYKVSVLNVLNGTEWHLDLYHRDGVHPPTSYYGAIINWQQASINWDYSGYDDFGREHVFATWVKSVGLGNGESELTDPDPSTECPS